MRTVWSLRIPLTLKRQVYGSLDVLWTISVPPGLEGLPSKRQIQYMYSIGENRMVEIYVRVHKAPSFSFSLHFLSKVPSKVREDSSG